MKRISIIFIALLFSIILISMEKVEFEITHFDDSDTIVQRITLVSDSQRNAIVQGKTRMIYYHTKDTLFLIDDSLKTSMKMSISMLGLFITGLSGNMEGQIDTSDIQVKKSATKYEYKGKYYLQFNIYSKNEKVFTAAIDESSEYPYTRKSIDKLDKILEKLIGFNIGFTSIKDVKGIPKVIAYYREKFEKIRTVIIDCNKGNYEKYFIIPQEYKTAY